MSTPSAKTAGRSTKTARRTVKKTAKSVAKSARKPVVKASSAAKSARNPVGKSTRPPHAAPAVAAKLASTMIRTASPPVQPAAPTELPIQRHKYQVGQAVYYTSPNFGRASATGNYTVVKLLPSEGDDYQYRIKSSGEAFERVAKESQLDKI
jgi:hypothetical protein